MNIFSTHKIIIKMYSNARYLVKCSILSSLPNMIQICQIITTNMLEYKYLYFLKIINLKNIIWLHIKIATVRLLLEYTVHHYYQYNHLKLFFLIFLITELV